MSTALLWTVLLISVGVSALWLIPKRPRIGWPLNTASEVLWLVYALTVHDDALALMAVIWGALAVRGTWLTYRARLKP